LSCLLLLLLLYPAGHTTYTWYVYGTGELVSNAQVAVSVRIKCTLTVEDYSLDSCGVISTSCFMSVKDWQTPFSSVAALVFASATQELATMLILQQNSKQHCIDYLAGHTMSHSRPVHSNNVIINMRIMLMMSYALSNNGRVLCIGFGQCSKWVMKLMM